MIDLLARLYALFINPLLTPLYVAAAVLFCPTTFSALVPMPYRLAVFAAFAVTAALLPLTVEVYLRIKHKIPRSEEIDAKYRRRLCILYAAVLLAAVFVLRTTPVFSLVVPLMKGVAALWIITAVAMTLRKTACREMIFLGGATAFLAILALTGAEQWTAILCAALLISGVAATAVVRLDRTSLAGSGIYYLAGIGTMLAGLYLL